MVVDVGPELNENDKKYIDNSDEENPEPRRKTANFHKKDSPIDGDDDDVSFGERTSVIYAQDFERNRGLTKVRDILNRFEEISDLDKSGMSQIGRSDIHDAKDAQFKENELKRVDTNQDMFLELIG